MHDLLTLSVEGGRIIIIIIFMLICLIIIRPTLLVCGDIIENLRSFNIILAEKRYLHQFLSRNQRLTVTLIVSLSDIYVGNLITGLAIIFVSSQSRF